MSEEPDAILVAGGKRHDGWKSVSIHMGIEELASTFQLSLTQRWTPSVEPVPIGVGERVELSIGDTLVLTGYVDDYSEDYDAQSHSVSVSGRSRTGDLADCAAIHAQMKGKNLLEVAEELCNPFGITASLSEPGLDIGGRLPTVVIQDGETVFETLNNLARKEGVLLMSDPRGNLVLSRASTTPIESADISFKENVKRGSVRTSGRERYSNYLIKGQVQGDDNVFGAGAAHLKHAESDDEVLRYRPLVLLEHGATAERLKQRATWERNTRAGRARVYTYDVRGWTHVRGLWTPNSLVRVTDSRLNIDDYLLVTSVELSRTLEQGRIATLELMARETFDVLKPPKQPRKKKKDPLGA